MKRRRFLIGSGMVVGGGSAAWAFDRYGIPGTHSNPYLEGNFAPVREIVSADRLKVTGVIPKELTGLYVRNGPNPMGSPNAKKYHWFQGTGMLHGIRIEEGKALWYKNRLVQSGGFTSNTHIISHANKIYAVNEAGGRPVEIDTKLDSKDSQPFQGTLRTGFSAHPKLDLITGELHAMCYDYASDMDNVHHVVVAGDGRVKSTRAIPLPSRSMLHECAITENYVLILDLSILFSFYKLGRGYFPFSWNDEHQARIGLLDRHGSSSDVKWFDIDPCYIFHTVNAHEDAQGNVVLDAMRYQRLFDDDWNGPFGEHPALLTRWSLNVSRGTAEEQQLDDIPTEFPRIHPDLAGQFNRYGYCLGVGAAKNPDFGRIIKYDLANGSSEVVELGVEKMAAEPVFIPTENQESEDEGYLVTYVYDKTVDKSELVIFNAQDLKSGPIAKIGLPQRVPFGFHGSWIEGEKALA